MAKKKSGRSWGNYAVPKPPAAQFTKQWAVNRYAALATKFRKDFPDAKAYQRKKSKQYVTGPSIKRAARRKTMDLFKKKSYVGTTRIGKGKLSNLKWRAILKSAYGEPLRRRRVRWRRK